MNLEELKTKDLKKRAERFRTWQEFYRDSDKMKSDFNGRKAKECEKILETRKDA